MQANTMKCKKIYVAIIESFDLCSFHDLRVECLFDYKFKYLMIFVLSTHPPNLDPKPIVLIIYLMGGGGITEKRIKAKMP